jgi:hypothetical protein
VVGSDLSDPLADIRGALRLVSAQCGASADLIVMGKNAADAFEVRDALSEIAELPERVSDPNWMQRLDDEWTPSVKKPRKSSS